jgi:hypothetical protein
MNIQKKLTDTVLRLPIASLTSQFDGELQFIYRELMTDPDRADDEPPHTSLTFLSVVCADNITATSS